VTNIKLRDALVTLVVLVSVSPFALALLAVAPFALAPFALAQDASAVPDQIAQRAFDAIGGKDKVLTLFRMQERYNAGAEAAAPDKSTPRESILEPPKYWWLGGKDRTGEPAKFVVWGWTLGVLLDPATSIEKVEGITENGRATLGLRVSKTIEPAMDLFFDAENHRLVRIDWKQDIYRYSEWKKTNGIAYPAKASIFKKGSADPWFHHEIVAIERLKGLPTGLSR
jgi:hypothetical protein